MNTTDAQVPEPVKSDHVSMIMPIMNENSIHKCTSGCPDHQADNLERQYQNVHPLLPWYKDDLVSVDMSYGELQEMLRPDISKILLKFLTEN